MYVCHCRSLSGCSIIGPINNKRLQPDIQAALHRKFGVNIEVASVFYRAEVGGEVFYSQEYLRAKVRNSHTIAYSDGRNKSYGLIKHFLSLPAFTVAVISCYSSSLLSWGPTSVEKLYHCKTTWSPKT